MMIMVDVMPPRNWVFALLLEKHFNALLHVIGAVHMVPYNLNLKNEGNLCFWNFLTVFVQFLDIMCCDWKPLLILQQDKGGLRTLFHYSNTMFEVKLDDPFLKIVLGIVSLHFCLVATQIIPHWHGLTGINKEVIWAQQARPRILIQYHVEKLMDLSCCSLYHWNKLLMDIPK